MPTNWSNLTADRMKQISGEAIANILSVIARPDIISFAGGLPAPEFFPRERIKEASLRLLDSPQAAAALQYSATEGVLPLRQMIAGEMNAAGVPVKVENILITTGSQQALDLLGRVLLNPGDSVIVEEPTYLGAVQAFDMYQPHYISVPTDDEGVIPARLEQALSTNPGVKFIYLIPTFQNPMGVTLTTARRREVVALAERFGVPIVEDDPYGELRYSGQPEPFLITLDAQLPGRTATDYPHTGNVVRLSTYSKTLCPGFRVAWVVAPAALVKLMAIAKSGSDMATSGYNQLLIHEIARDNFIARHVLELRKVYAERRGVMLEVMEECFPSGVTWTRPDGGLFLWVRLPKGFDSAKLLARAVEEQKVAYVPGAPFHPTGGGENTLRLNFSNAQPPKIQEGIRRLASVFKQ